ncbi:MAG: bifunctional phosphopantothenoylcysteine decarboxylase/phosphopantothenate--cysteine ligase CoaBC [Actinobacteria bacterium]|nr:bifunctional phosphopantothenoylcysteine decarboxylase/phosphopantothenate--cysteine ligase CoaBC [Actinomycetota bacterium]
MLAGRTVVLGVTGGIAAYKAVEVCRRLVDAGAHVSPIMTEGAERFVGRATFDALASEPVQASIFGERDPIPHTRLGQKADLVLVCPATARLLGSYAAGISDDLLTATLLATRAPVVVCPAMHTEMWEHAAVQANLETLRARGVHVVPPESGRLAGGDLGAGRLAEPETIVAEVERVVAPKDLDGWRVLVSAGGTREPIDPVRVITNRSSGKQGYALAEAALDRGAKVTLVTTVDRPAPAGAEVVRVGSAAEMQDAIVPRASQYDLIIMAAAVADFRVADPADHKLKKTAGRVPTIELAPTHDFLVDLGQSKPRGQVLVGFAAETQDVVASARDKLTRKNLDLIVANDVSAPGTGFEHDTNAVTIVTAGGAAQRVDLASKRTIADAVLDAVISTRG